MPTSETDCTVKESLADEKVRDHDDDVDTNSRGSTTSPKNASNADRSVPDGSDPTSRADQTEPVGSVSTSSQSQMTKSNNDSHVTNGGGIRMCKVTDYSVEKFNRLLDRLDKGNFLIKSNFKKSYSLILTRSNGAGRGVSGVGNSTKECNNDSNNNCNDSVGGHGRKKKGNLIKANSSMGIYHQSAKSNEQREEQSDSKRKSPVMHDLNSIGDTGIQPDMSATGREAAIERVNERRRLADVGNNYNAKSLSLSYCNNEGGVDNNNDSDEFCRSEIFDNDSTVPESQPDFVQNDLTGDAERREKIVTGVPARKMENNYENIHPYSSSTLGHCPRKHIRRKSNISYWNHRQEDNNGQPSLSKAEHETGSNNDARNKSAIPTRFFKRQDYAQPELDFPSDHSEVTGEEKTFSKRGPKFGTDLFQLPFGGSRKKHDKTAPQLKNINLNFPNKTTYIDEQQLQQPQQPPTKVVRQPHLVLQPVHWQKNENKYFNKAKTQILKLGQRCKLIGSGKEKRNHYISSYNLDDLIKATHKYEENEKSNLSNKIVYKSYKSELDLTKNLAYLDTFLNETFDANDPPQQEGARKVRKPTRHGHKRAKSCSKTLDQMLMTASTTTAQLPQRPNNARTPQNLILLDDDAWSGLHKKVNSDRQLKNNMTPTASRSNKTKLASLIKMENDFSATVANEEDPFSDARLMLAGEKSGRSNTTSSSLSSSDYASVYSAPSSSGAGGTSSSATNKMQNLKLIGTPDEALLRSCGERDVVIEHSTPKRHSKSRHEEYGDNLNRALLLDDASSYYSLRANKSHHQIHNNFSDCTVSIEQRYHPHHHQDQDFHPHDFHNASTLQLPRLAQTNPFRDSSSHRHHRATRDSAQYRKQQNNPHHRRHHHQRQWHHHRQSPLEADLTYQEDYLEHYQNTRAAAAASLGSCFNPARSRGGSVASSAATIESNCDSSLEYFANQSYHYGNTIIDNDATLRNNISANERNDYNDDDDDDEDDVDGEDDASNSPAADNDDEEDATDDNDDNPNGDNDGNGGGKSVISSNHGYGNHLAAASGRSRAHSFTNNISPGSDLLSSSRSFSRGTTTAKLSGTVNPGFLSSYGPHRVIVSKSHKQHGAGGRGGGGGTELVLEYEC